MRKKIGVIHCMARCEDCGKEFVSYKNAQALSAIHARKYQHKVVGEVALGFTYEGRIKC